jgi:2-keto-3-deoxy-L-arabinonate dehydratase
MIDQGSNGCKTIMKEGGVIKSDAVRHPLEALHPGTRAGLLELVRPLDPIALRWDKE